MGQRLLSRKPFVQIMNSKCDEAVFFNGKIYTMDVDKMIASAIVVGGGRIVIVGGDSEAKRDSPRGCDRFDLGGRVVLPGFIDCHTHFIQMGVDSMSTDLSRTRTLDEALSAIRKAASEAAGDQWVVATSWKESGWPGGRFITRQDLDSCCPNNPAVAHRVCGHLSTVNSKALDLLCIDSKTPDVDIGKGILRESAVSLVRTAMKPDRAKKRKGLALAIKKAHSLGVTSINDNGDSSDFEAYGAAEMRGKLGVRIWFNTPSRDLDSRIRFGLSTGFGSDRLKFGGVKIFCDGALGARTAALSEAYSDDPGNRGMLVHKKSELDQMIATASEADIQVAIHAIGDVGIGEAISSFANAARGKSCRISKILRNRIEHLELPSRAHLREMRRLGLIASMQPNFIGEWGGADGMYLSRLGPERTIANNPFREVLKARVKLVFGSDCMPFSPIYGIHSAVNAPNPAQRLSAQEAVAAYTSDAAFASFEERSKGTLTQGKMADFIVLSGDPFVDPEEIRSIKVLRTILNGEVLYDKIRT